MPLIYFWIVEGHHLEWVFYQFGMKQLVPLVVDMSTDLHKIDLQGKWDRDWPTEHVTHIQQWANRGQLVRVVPLLDGDTTYLVDYMRWYDHSIRQYITLKFVYWEIMVRQQFLPLC